MRAARARAMACAAAVASIAPSAAAGATVEVTKADKIRYVAGAGEHNAPSISAIPESWPSAYFVRDPGASVTPGPGCLAIDALRVGCFAFGGALYDLRFDLGDEDDVLRLEGSSSVQANGGPGDDQLFGGDSFDELDGGGGRDELRGGDGFDRVTDGDRDDGGGQLDADVLDGGRGYDMISYELRTRMVAVDLAASLGGAPGENDALVGFEEVRGGTGDDRLLGDDADNHIDGGGGADRLDGRGGDDWISHAGGAHVACGEGADSVQNVTVQSVLRTDCETVIRGFGDGGQFTADAVPRRRGDGLTLRLVCPTDEGGGAPCTGTVQVRSGSGRGTMLAHGTIPARNGRLTVALTLTAPGRRLLTARRPQSVVVAFAARRTAGLTWTLRLPRGGIPR
jgi:Ca2+-binding RTX toxin-like protein